ncbi:hypothetical protein [Streptomyces sp. 147326]|uniref:hypothetical protein n=1 Tax=Streptomyces sp. 147326 TaxID=3074379 RepID=UPI00385799E0
MTSARQEGEPPDWSGEGREDHYHPLARGAAVTRQTVLGAMAGRKRNADGIERGWRDRDPEYAAVLSALRIAWEAR